jgi:crotonobetainyl-CoA:carnitine CoA-transferase CaiB-like acyl-CoA transferase
MLSRYRILEFTDGPEAIGGQMLADLGADVVLVEPPEGAGTRRLGPFYQDKLDANTSLPFWATNRGKRSVCIDIESAEGRRGFLKLVGESDALIESRPGQLADCGLDYEHLSKLHPELVVVSITPFGLEGPKARWPATDLTITAASGALILSGDEDRPPLVSSLPQAMLHAGSEAAIGALLALEARERDGLGQHVDVSAQTAMMMATQSYVLCHGWNDAEMGRAGGGYRAGELRGRFVYPCQDGYVSIAMLFGPGVGLGVARLFKWMWEEGFVDEATRDKDWEAFYAALMSGEEPMCEHDRIVEAVDAFTRSHTKAELFEGALERDVLLVPVSDMSDVAQSRQLASREFWMPVSHPEFGTDVTYPGAFARFGETPIQYRERPPLLGEHTAELLAEPREERQTLPSSGAVDPDRPLAGLKVLDFTWVYAGPAATRCLADYGATVVRIETQQRIDGVRLVNPQKDGEHGLERSGNYANANAGKLGLSLNLSTPEARDVVLRLAAWADVVVENFSPKAMKAWGLDYPRLRSINPQVIMASSCLNGQTGPLAMQAGFGMMGAAQAGFGYLTGWPDRNPTGPPTAYTDYVSPKFLVASILAALEARRRTGRGQYIDLSQAECSVHFLGEAALDYFTNGRIAKPLGNASPLYAPTGVYPCVGEDRWVALAAPDGAAWSALCAIADPTWASDPRFATMANRLANYEALDEQIAVWTARHDVAEIEDLLLAAGVPVHRVSTSADVFSDPQLEAREHIVLVEHPMLGPVPLENSRLRLSRTPATVAAPGPTVGQHNQHVLAEILGMSEDEMTELVLCGALD